MIQQDFLRHAMRYFGVFICVFGFAVNASAQKKISQAQALAGGVTPGDSPGFPVTISKPGVYVLTSNLEVPDVDTTAVAIIVSNVTIDLGGFTIIGPDNGNGSGQGISSPTSNTIISATVVRNGTIFGMGSDGIFASGRGNRIDRVTVVNNGGHGIDAGPAAHVTRSRAAGNTFVGIQASDASIVEQNVSASNTWGIAVGAGSTVIGNIALDNTSFGFIVDESGWGHNVASNNNGGNANPQYGGTGIALSGGNLCGGALCP